MEKKKEWARLLLIANFFVDLRTERKKTDLRREYKIILNADNDFSQIWD